MIVYWSEDGEEAYQNVFACATEPTVDNQEIVDGVFKNLAMGRAIVVDEVEKALSPDQRFYILGVLPMLPESRFAFSIRIVFGNIMKNIKEHYGEDGNCETRRGGPTGVSWYLADASGDGKQKSRIKNLFPVCLEQSIRQLYQAVVIRRPLVPGGFGKNSCRTG